MADIDIIYGSDAREMTLTLLREAAVGKRLRPGMNVVIKPNLVVAKPAEEGATTHPEIVEGLVLFLKEHGIDGPVIAEGSWLGETTQRAFARCGYEALAKKYGLRLFDTKKDKVVKKTFGGGTFGVCEIFLAVDFLINVPVLKGHCQTKMTCCLKNLKGCIPDSEKRRYHSIGLHEPIAALGAILRPDLHLVDGICGDPTFEEGGNPVVSNRLLLGTDPVLLDSYGAKLLGWDPPEIDYLRLAAGHGIGTMAGERTTIREHSPERRPKADPTHRSEVVRRLAKKIDEQSACSACYAALILALRKAETYIPDGKIKIGQGFRGKRCEGVGVGNCTAGCQRSVPGCPPTAVEILRFLEAVTNVEAAGRSRE